MGFHGLNPVDNPAHHVGDPVQMIYGTEQGVWRGWCLVVGKEEASFAFGKSDEVFYLWFGLVWWLVENGGFGYINVYRINEVGLKYWKILEAEILGRHVEP